MSSSNVEQMRMATPVKSGVYCKKKTILLITGVIVCLFVGAILATYFGTKASHNSTKNEATTDKDKSTTKAPMPKIDYRLPTNIKPHLYELEIQPYIGPEAEYGSKAWTFNGTMTMHINCESPTNKIVFHALELEIQNPSLILTSSGEVININSELEFDAEKQFVIINLESDCIKGSDYKLIVPYSGIILEKLTGFYRSSYVENGTLYNIASTDFEPTDARRAFPCFDEPAMKARFQLTLIRHKNFTRTLFNAPLITSVPHESQSDWLVDKFGKSEIMSTYLVAFVVSNFELIEKKSPKYGVDIGVAARQLAIRDGEGDFALDEAAKIIDFYSDYFNVSYPTPKSTQVAIPDFNSGAMENWGLVFYRESALLYNPKTDTVKNKQRVSLVIAHELAHQWNGNLVTMAWWSDLWLNEGFASWIENIGKNHTHPEWRDLEYFFIESMQAVMVKDSLASSHPIVQTVNNPSEIGGLFDKISYDKGSSIIRMMNSFLGESTFVHGVSNYLKKYSFSNAYQDDLWAELTKAAHQDGTLESSTTVKDIMDTWTLQKGYPVVTIAKEDNNKVKASQKWFLLNPLNNLQGTEEYEKYKWYVPITVTTKDEQDFDFEKRPVWLKPSIDSLSIDVGSKDNEWFIGNVKHSGFYRVNYDDNNWKLLLEQMNNDHTLIDATSRATLIDDSFNLGRAELIDQTKYLDMVSYLNKEEDPLPFTAALDGLEYMYSMLETDYESFQLFNKFYASLLKNAYERYGWNLTLTDANDINLQTSVLRIMCRSGYQPCIDKARSFYNKWLNSDEALPSNFKSTIYSTVIESGDQETWQEFFQKTLATQNAAEKLRMLYALTKSKDLNILKFYLSQTSDDSVVKKQDEATIVRLIALNSYGRQLAFEYMDANWDTLLEKYGNVAFTLPSIVKSLTENFNSKFELMKLERFSVDHPDTGIAESAFAEAAETISSNVRWMDKNLQAIKLWLQSNSGAMKF